MSLFNGEDLFYDGKQMCKESILSYGQDSLSLVAFMVSWLSIYTLPHGLSDIIRPSTIYPAMCLVIGYKFPLCSALVTRLCSGLRSQIVGGQETYPSMIFYAWYCLHCNAPSQCCNFPRPPFHRHLKNNSFHFTTKGIHCQLRMWTHYQFIGRIPHDPNDFSKVHGELASNGTGTLWLKCVRPSLLVFYNEEPMELEPYYPSQFTFSIWIFPGKPCSAMNRMGNLREAYSCWLHFKSIIGGVLFSYPKLSERPVLSHAFCIWYSMSTK